jgi:hypothetical protein
MADSEFEQDLLPERLVPDPEHPRRVVAFVGFLGRSHRDGYKRLYLDEELRDWFEVEDAQILHTERVGSRESGSVEYTILWIDQRTTVERRQAQPEDLQGDFLTGELSAATVPQAAILVALDASVELRTWWKSRWCLGQHAGYKP